ncbi:hypothetical protein J6590_015479 [Homalodisca vitripennis]|nr:hypothetical protein J6590_015479 [Homalodisca vitripennis]
MPASRLYLSQNHYFLHQKHTAHIVTEAQDVRSGDFSTTLVEATLDQLASYDEEYSRSPHKKNPQAAEGRRPFIPQAPRRDLLFSPLVKRLHYCSLWDQASNHGKGLNSKLWREGHPLYSGCHSLLPHSTNHSMEEILSLHNSSLLVRDWKVLNICIQGNVIPLRDQMFTDRGDVLQGLPLKLKGYGSMMVEDPVGTNEAGLRLSRTPKHQTHKGLNYIVVVGTPLPFTLLPKQPEDASEPITPPTTTAPSFHHKQGPHGPSTSRGGGRVWSAEESGKQGESRNKTTHLGPKTYERCIVPPLDLYRQTNCMLKLFRTQHAGDLPETPLPWLYFRSHASGGNVSRDSL